MDKFILIQYSDAVARIKLVREEMEKKQRHLERLRDTGYLVSDSVSCGKRGKKRKDNRISNTRSTASVKGIRKAICAVNGRRTRTFRITEPGRRIHSRDRR